jgi:hypothetical protein
MALEVEAALRPARLAGRPASATSRAEILPRFRSTLTSSGWVSGAGRTLAEQPPERIPREAG